ncbi:MAG: hypothetical protein RLZ98_3098 [Pseudomonadota bacterium]|jgi:nucleotide-binding universal stress UspA family protein
MTIKTLLVFLDDGGDSTVRFDAACSLASTFGAHVSAVGTSLQVYTHFVAGPEGADMTFDVEQIETARAKAAAVASEAKTRLIEQKLSADARWISHEAIGLTEAAGRQARHADLSIVGQPTADENASLREAILDGALFSSGRPVLIIPTGWSANAVGKKIVVAWDASREAARAVNDALPLIERADSTTVVVVDPVAGGRGWGEEPGADISASLARHGQKVTLERVPSSGRSISETLQMCAVDAAADLVVMGGYGHSQFRESIFGGVSRDMIHGSKVPLLLSH